MPEDEIVRASAASTLEIPLQWGEVLAKLYKNSTVIIRLYRFISGPGGLTLPELAFHEKATAGKHS